MYCCKRAYVLLQVMLCHHVVVPTILLQTYICLVANLHMSCCKPTYVLLGFITCIYRFQHMSCYNVTYVLLLTWTCPVAHVHMSCCKHAHVLLQTCTCPVEYKHMSCCKPAHVLLLTCSLQEITSVVARPMNPVMWWRKVICKPQNAFRECDAIYPLGGLCLCTLRMSCYRYTYVLSHKSTCPVAVIYMSCCIYAHVLLVWYSCQ